jgi:two-component system, OmpR family, sensor histidine kinase VicK
MRLSLRLKILVAILSAVVVTDVLAAWAINRRIEAGADREADAQARAQAAQARALYTERAATLTAEGEAVSLYPAVITAIDGGNAQPLLTWASRVSAKQGARVTVVGKDGRVVARGHDPDNRGDDLASKLEGVRLALDGKLTSGAEDGDELGFALRGYAPVRQNGTEGPVVGAVMIADPFDEHLLGRLAGTDGGATDLRIDTGAPASERCETAGGGPATCRFGITSPSGQPVASVTLSVPLADIQQARTDARQAAWWVLAGLALAGAVAAWLLSGTLTRRLHRLTSSAHRIAGGDFSQPAGVRGKDEIGTLGIALDTMRERVGAATAALRDERDVLDAVLESTEDAILMTDHAGKVAVGNDRWRSMLGGEGLPAARDLTRIDGNGGTFAQVAASWLRDPERLARADFEQHEPSYRRFRCFSGPVHLPDGTQAIPDSGLRTEDSGLIGRIFVLRDVTRESEAERMRTALVSTVSHELRSPLTSIKGYTDTLLDGGPWDEETEREFLEIIRVSSEKLSGLVDNLLDAAKMEAGVLKLEQEPVRVERIVQQVVAHKRLLAPNHPLTAEIDPDLPVANADPFRVEQVVTNLVENAIKYSPEGGPITVRVRGGDEITVSVSDRGVGVTKEQAERLFERFYRVDSSLARTTKGVGLGLFICRSLVEAHGGRIWVESRPGEGSTFSFTLPAMVVAEHTGHGEAWRSTTVPVRTREKVLR